MRSRLYETELPSPVGALSSAEERCLHTAEVTGSIPVAPTLRIPCKHRGFFDFRILDRASGGVRCPSSVRRSSGAELAGLPGPRPPSHEQLRSEASRNGPWVARVDLADSVLTFERLEGLSSGL